MIIVSAQLMLPILTPEKKYFSFIFPKGVLSSFVDLECIPQETGFAGKSNDSVMDFKDLGFPEVI